MTLSTTQIENQAENHRAHISELIDELRNRVSPGEVLDQFLGWEDGHEIARNFGRQVKGNPLPLALIGTGVAWLLLSDTLQRPGGTHTATSPRSFEKSGNGFAEGVRSGVSRAGDSVSDATDYVKSAAGSTRDTLSDTASRVSDSASSAFAYGRQTATDLADTTQDAYAKARDTVSAATENVTSTASSAWQKTTQFTQSATDTIKNTGSNLGSMAQDQPLLAAGLGFALGAALGAILPGTETENSLLGEQSDVVKDKAGDLAAQGYEKAKTVAQKSYQAATEAAKQEAEKQGLSSGEEAQQPSEAEAGSRSEHGEPSYGGNNGGDYTTGVYPRH